MMDIRRKTCVIIRRGNEYLVARVIYSRELLWSSSPWDAWRTRDKEAARRVAGFGGKMMLFNPVAAQLREVNA